MKNVLINRDTSTRNVHNFRKQISDSSEFQQVQHETTPNHKILWAVVLAHRGHPEFLLIWVKGSLARQSCGNPQTFAHVRKLMQAYAIGK
jgi:hypothetical protein